MANRNTNKNTNQKGGKGGKGGKNKPEEEPAPDLINKDGETLRSMIMQFRDRLTDLKAKRSYAQEERDLINNFFENTRKDIDEHRVRVANKDTEAEQLEESHRVEVKVYLQKVKHLEYDQKLNNKRIKMEGDEAGRAEDEYHKDWLGHMKAEKTRKKKDYTETEKKHETDVQLLNQQQDKMMKKLKTEYDTKINNMINNYEELLRKLREDLELKIRVEIHEIEERKNQHINELMKNHEAAFTELKTYYNDITRENLQVIQGQKQDLENLQASLQTNNKLIAEIKAKNKKMEDPLNKNRKLRDELKYEVRLHEKDKMSLDNLKIKFATLKDKIRKLERAQEQLDARYLQVLQERKDLEDRFERITMEVKMHAELKNEVLAKKLGELENHFEYKETQLQQLVQRAAIDPSIVSQLLQKIQQSIESKNSLLKNLQYSIHHATKAYNDAVRVYETKLAEFGIPPDELGFEPLESKTSVMPAGLVSS